METALDLSRWREAPRGVGYRRWVILSTGLRQILATRFFKILIYVAWLGGVLIAAGGFLFSQTVTSGGWLEGLVSDLGPRPEAWVKALGALVVMYPDICVSGVFTVIFWLHSFLGLTLCLIALTVVVPQLIARDRASHAMTIYLSRPLTSADYLLGKFGMVVGLLLVLWTGPLLAGWGLSMALSSDRDFIVHSIQPLLRALLFNGLALAVLAPLAIGVSALGRSSRVVIGLWIGLWLVGGAVAKFPNSPGWLRHASFTANLAEVRLTVLPVDQALSDAATKLPFLDANLKRNLERTATLTRPKEFRGAVAGLGLLVLLSSGICLRRLRAE